MNLSSSQIIVLATPVFLLLIAAEYAYGRAKGRNTYRLDDAISSISLGILSQISAVFTRLLRIGIYTLVFEQVALVRDDAWWSTWYGALLALVLYDFCYYWVHRTGHEINILWASHVIHHSSEEFNLACALRQSISGIAKTFAIFLLPAALLGVPDNVIVIVAPLHLFAQFDKFDQSAIG